MKNKYTAEYEASRKAEKDRIKGEFDKRKRVKGWIVYYLLWPFKWIWMACHDWRLILIFVGWAAVVGSDVWVPLAIAWLVPSLRASMLAVAGVCEAVWLGPVPFLPICVFLTMGTKAMMDKIAEKNVKRK